MGDPSGQAAIDSLLQEHRVFPPPESFSRRAAVPSRARYDELYRRSVDDPDAFWAEMAERLRWTTRWERVLDWQSPVAKWFVGRTRPFPTRGPVETPFTFHPFANGVAGLWKASRSPAGLAIPALASVIALP